MQVNKEDACEAPEELRFKTLIGGYLKSKKKSPELARALTSFVDCLHSAKATTAGHLYYL